MSQIDNSEDITIAINPYSTGGLFVMTCSARFGNRTCDGVL